MKKNIKYLKVVLYYVSNGDRVRLKTAVFSFHYPACQVWIKGSQPWRYYISQV